jgi:beta-glucosidase
VPQLYLTEAAGKKRMRLQGFERVHLQREKSCSVTVTADPRLLARYDGDASQWNITEGNYRVWLGHAADDPVLTDEVPLTGRFFGR